MALGVLLVMWFALGLPPMSLFWLATPRARCLRWERCGRQPSAPFTSTLPGAPFTCFPSQFCHWPYVFRARGLMLALGALQLAAFAPSTPTPRGTPFRPYFSSFCLLTCASWTRGPMLALGALQEGLAAFSLHALPLQLERLSNDLSLSLSPAACVWECMRCTVPVQAICAHHC